MESKSPNPSDRTIAVVEIIGSVNLDSKGSLSLTTVAPLLDMAFMNPNTTCVMLKVNSGGGSTTQCSLIYERIRTLSKVTGKPVYSFVEDYATSGGYWIALAGDKIFCSGASQIGSLGVISSRFDFSGLLELIGAKKIVSTRSPLKSTSDPFVRHNEDQAAMLAEVQADIENQFIEVVRERRTARIGDTMVESLFDGRVWSGRQALACGLVDGIGDARAILHTLVQWPFSTQLMRLPREGK